MEATYVDHLGSDLTVVNAARVSFSKTSTELSEKDVGLIRYLANHNHWTPFGHAQVTFRFKTPIFVARQLVKHQIGLVWNEVSRRYVDDTPEFYFPDRWRGRPTNGMKQGSNPDQYVDILSLYSGIPTGEFAKGYCATIAKAYETLIEEGVAPEQARMILPQNMYTEWYWTGSLAAWARVWNLRVDPHAQAETQDVVRMIGPDMERLFPYSWTALTGDNHGQIRTEDETQDEKGDEERPDTSSIKDVKEDDGQIELPFNGDPVPNGDPYLDAENYVGNDGPWRPAMVEAVHEHGEPLDDSMRGGGPILLPRHATGGSNTYPK